VADRTKKLRRSYRTPQAILASANRILAQYAQDDPDDFLVPDLSGMETGVKPLLIHTDSPQDAVDRLVNELSASVRERIIGLDDLLVIYGENVQKALLYHRLCKEFGEDGVWWLNKKEHRKAPPKGYEREYLRLASLETATGLEASIVFLVGMENLFSSGKIPDLGEEEQIAMAEENARKLYMAMTRAGQRLILLSSQRIPTFVEDSFIQWAAPEPA
jgi:superfamily I DNA/RNA helicase